MSILLRPFVLEDAESICEYANNPTLAHDLRDPFPVPYTLEDAYSFLRYATQGDNKECVFAISHNGEAIGCISYQLRYDFRLCTAEIGYWLGERFWGRGYATAAVALLEQMIWANPKVERLYAEVFADNIPSCTVLERSGFTRLHLLEKSILKNGAYRDSVTYEKLRGV